jgi:GT2 family glycosyltransferase
MPERVTGTRSSPRVACILLNWNGWRDTIECLESIFRLDYPDFQIVVCDNASADGSLERIKEWARGAILAESGNRSLQDLTSPPVPKPIPYRELTREQAESGNASREDRLILIQVGANLGFAGGNNVGLRYALKDPECQLFWLINNDTVVDPNALSAMISHVKELPAVGLCGSLNISYHNPTQVLAQGGMPYCRWTGRAQLPPPGGLKEVDSHATVLDFVNGASMLASRAFVEQVGLMEESYFLYFEEHDWAIRAKGKFQLGYCQESVVYHKEGATIGSSRHRSKRSLLAEMYNARNKILFTKRFHPWAVPTVLLVTCIAAVQQLLLGDLRRVRVMLVSTLTGLLRHIPRTSEVSAVQINQTAKRSA